MNQMRKLKLRKGKSVTEPGASFSLRTARPVFPSSSLDTPLPARPQGRGCFRAGSLVTECGSASGSEVTCGGSSSVQTCHPSSKKALSMCPDAGPPPAPLLPLLCPCWVS